jgi:uncharacterized damage-inducible protein DinB
MTPQTALRELIDYNYRARDRQLQACAALSEEQFLRLLGASFPSVRDTLAPVVAVEWVWLERWQGRSPQALLAAEQFPTLATISERGGSVERVPSAPTGRAKPGPTSSGAPSSTS